MSGIEKSTKQLSSGATVPAGGSTSSASVGGIVEWDATSASTTVLTEESLREFIIPATVWDVDGRVVRLFFSVSTAANTNSKTVRVRHGNATTGTEIVVRSAAFNNVDGIVEVEIMRSTDAAQHATGKISIDVFVPGVGYTTLAFDETVDQPFYLTGTTPTAAGDLTYNFGYWAVG